VEDWSYWKEDQWGSHECDETRFPDPAGMIKTLHEKYHTQFMISFGQSIIPIQPIMLPWMPKDISTNATWSLPAATG
jgi:hypothetical protein